MSTLEKLHATVNEWNDSLDAGDIERLVATCDPNVITCNEKQPMSVGIQAIRDKYEPRIAAAHFKSTVEIEDTQIFGDFAVMVTHFNVEMTDKKTGDKRNGKGRLVLGYRLDENGEWKMALDVDNNDVPAND
ncbi:MAG: hypothetical protein CBB87_01080 [Micavibrio sp. TMED27]|nr:hypothetical protein [Micavibrio sp.]OUT92364.1 MAG: hypothetical protein CBB87_01080 [Micavibrio sp. TMED27]|tara:strand:- start:84 stop:479 length:396 start_codon:yes stop_codon:yes gene_type:complete